MLIWAIAHARSTTSTKLILAIFWTPTAQQIQWLLMHHVCASVVERDWILQRRHVTLPQITCTCGRWCWQRPLSRRLGRLPNVRAKVHFVEYFDARERWQHIEPGRVSELLAATSASVAVCTCDDSESDNGDLNERLAMFRRRVEDIPLDVAVFLDHSGGKPNRYPRVFNASQSTQSAHPCCARSTRSAVALKSAEPGRF